MAGESKDIVLFEAHSGSASQTAPHDYGSNYQGLMTETKRPLSLTENILRRFSESQLDERRQTSTGQSTAPTVENAIDEDLISSQPDAPAFSYVESARGLNISRSSDRHTTSIPQASSLLNAGPTSTRSSPGSAMSYLGPTIPAMDASDQVAKEQPRPRSRRRQRSSRVRTLPPAPSSSSRSSTEDFIEPNNTTQVQGHDPSSHNSYPGQTMHTNSRSTPYGPNGSLPRPATTHHTPYGTSGSSGYGYYPPVQPTGPHLPYGVSPQAIVPMGYDSRPTSYFGSQYPYSPAYGYPQPPPLPPPLPNYLSSRTQGTPAASVPSERPQLHPENSQKDILNRFEALLVAQQARQDQFERERREQSKSVEEQVMLIRRSEQERRAEEARIRQEAIREAQEQAEAAAKARAERTAEEARIREDAARATREAMAAEAAALAEKNARDAKIREEAVQQLPEVSRPQETIHFINSRKQTFIFPLSDAKRWEGMMKLVQATHRNSTAIQSPDSVVILDAGGNHILPTLWPKIVKPGATYSMQLDANAKDLGLTADPSGLASPTYSKLDEALSDKYNEHTPFRSTNLAGSASGVLDLQYVFDNFSKQLQHAVRIEQDRARSEVRQDLLKHITGIAMLNGQQSDPHGANIITKSTTSSVRDRSEPADTPEMYRNASSTINGATDQAGIVRQWRGETESVELGRINVTPNAKHIGRELVPDIVVGEANAIQDQITQLETLLAAREREEALSLANQQLRTSRQRLQALEARLQTLELSSSSGRITSSSRTQATTMTGMGTSQRTTQGDYGGSTPSQVDRTTSTSTKRGSGSSWRALGKRLSRVADGSSPAGDARSKMRTQAT